LHRQSDFFAALCQLGTNRNKRDEQKKRELEYCWQKRRRLSEFDDRLLPSPECSLCSSADGVIASSLSKRRCFHLSESFGGFETSVGQFKLFFLSLYENRLREWCSCEPCPKALWRFRLKKWDFVELKQNTNITTAGWTIWKVAGIAADAIGVKYPSIHHEDYVSNVMRNSSVLQPLYTYT